MINIVKASAGSGKTYAITQEYIKYLTDSKLDDAYRHILAVTFTNKATDEMKRRVLKRLFEMSGDESSAEGRKARKMLISILHDYSNFSITTIDRFFQQVMRSFAREMGSYSTYKVELDDESVIASAIDMMIDSLEKEENGQLLDWLVQYTLDNVKDGGSYKIQNELFSMASLFLQEEFRIKKKAPDSGFEMDRAKLAEIKREMGRIIGEFEGKLRKIGGEAIDILSANGLSITDLKGGSRTSFKCFHSWKNGDFVPPAKSFYDFSDDPRTWVSSSGYKEKGTQIEGAADSGLWRLIREAADLFGEICTDGKDVFYAGEEYVMYCTARLIGRSLNVSGIFSDLYRCLADYMKENDLMLLSETNELINSIIDGSDTPFVYERMGTRYDNLMLDEFQDTSVLQWKNFKPLFDNSVSQHFDNMIVGDVKQSIYRWRGSDWKMLQSGLFQDFDNESLISCSLSINYRSKENIISFNNKFFPAMLAELGEPEVESLYKEDIIQKVNEPDGKGYVRVEFVSKETTYDYLKDAIGSLTAKGYPLDKITILVRYNKEATEVARWLIANGYSVITEESMLVSASLPVLRLMAAIRYLSAPKNSLNGLILRQMNIDIDAICNGRESLYDICEHLVRGKIGELAQGDIPYLNAFMDCVCEYCAKNGNNLAGFVKWWDETGAKSRYIAAPDGENAIRVMTIHKSKGLSLDAVILPHFQETMRHNASKPYYMWCNARKLFPGIGILPVKYKKDLMNTVFREDYLRETIDRKVDAMNTAYVAFTRAKSAMLVYAVKPEEGASSLANVSDVLYAAMNRAGLDSDVYESGEIMDYKHEIEPYDSSSALEQMEIDEFLSVPMEGSGYVSGCRKPRLKVVLSSGEYFDGGQDSVRFRGIVLHNVLSRIKTSDDIEKAVEDAVNEGELSASDAQSVCRQILSVVSDARCSDWFAAGSEVLNEVSIVDGQGNLQRPDRVVVKDGSATVIDYKFGEENVEYERQVLRYVSLLQQMGYETKGFLCYVKDNIKVVEVTPKSLS